MESSLLYDCQVRVWYKRDMKRLQRWVDKCYRYVWSDRNGEPLRQMEARGVNTEHAGREELSGGEEREMEDREESTGKDWACGSDGK